MFDPFGVKQEYSIIKTNFKDLLVMVEYEQTKVKRYWQKTKNSVSESSKTLSKSPKLNTN